LRVLQYGAFHLTRLMLHCKDDEPDAERDESHIGDPDQKPGLSG
jgi:hypothetical protein